MVRKDKAYKLDLSVYVPSKDSKDPVLVHVKDFDLAADGKDIMEVLESIGGVITTHIEGAEEYDVDIWERVKFMTDEEYEREWDLIDEEETEYWQKKSEKEDLGE